MSRWTLIALLVLAGCAVERVNRYGTTNRDANTIADALVIAGAIAVAIAITGDPEPPGPWCDADERDPPHTCPAKAGEDSR